jgi:hypothetical protein
MVSGVAATSCRDWTPPGSPVSALSAGITRFSAPLARSLFQPHFIWTCNLLFRRFIGFALRYTPASIMRALPNAPLRAKRRGRGSPTACMECRIRKQKVTGCVPRGWYLLLISVNSARGGKALLATTAVGATHLWSVSSSQDQFSPRPPARNPLKMARHL